MNLSISKNRIPFFKAILHVVFLYPLVNLYVGAFYDRLGADPVEQVIHFTGMGALNPSDRPPDHDRGPDA